MQLVIGRRVVEELVKDDGNARKDDAQIIRPPPSSSGFLDERTSNNRSEHCTPYQSFAI